MRVLDTISEESSEVLLNHILRSSKPIGSPPPLGSFFHETICDPGEMIPTGEVAERCFVVSGCVQLITLGPDSPDFIHQFGIPTWWVGDERAFARKSKPELGVVALRKSIVLTIDPSSQENLISQFPGFGLYLLWVYERTHAALQRRLWYSETMQAQERYELLVETQPEFVQLVPQHRLAAYLGISAEHLSRIRQRRFRS